MKPIDFAICFVAAVLGAVLFCQVHAVVGIVVGLAAYGGGHYLYGEGADVRQVRAHNATVRYRNQQRDEFKAAGGQGEPPNLIPLAPMPTRPNYGLGIVAVLAAGGLVWWLLQ